MLLQSILFNGYHEKTDASRRAFLVGHDADRVQCYYARALPKTRRAVRGTVLTRNSAPGAQRLLDADFDRVPADRAVALRTGRVAVYFGRSLRYGRRSDASFLPD